MINDDAGLDEAVEISYSADSLENIDETDDCEESFYDLEEVEIGDNSDLSIDESETEEFCDLFDVDTENDWDPTLTDEQMSSIEDMEQNGELDVLPSELGEASYSHLGEVLTDTPIVVDMPYNPNASYDVEDFIAQALNQEFGLNQLTVAEFLENYEMRQNSGRSAEGSKMQHQYKEGLQESLIFDMMEQNPDVTLESAKAQVADMLEGGASLHDPDQIAGGSPEEIHGYGSAGANSALGSLWGHGRAEALYDQIKEFSEGKTEEELENTRLNVRFDIHSKS